MEALSGGLIAISPSEMQFHNQTLTRLRKMKARWSTKPKTDKAILLFDRVRFGNLNASLGARRSSAHWHKCETFNIETMIDSRYVPCEPRTEMRLPEYNHFLYKVDPLSHEYPAVVASSNSGGALPGAPRSGKELSALRAWESERLDFEPKRLTVHVMPDDPVAHCAFEVLNELGGLSNTTFSADPQLPDVLPPDLPLAEGALEILSP